MAQEWSVANVAPFEAELAPCERPQAALSASQIEGRTLVSLISPGTEMNWGYRNGPFPNTQGYAAILEVERVGEGVQGVRPGDWVFAQGQHRSWQRVEAIETRPVPEGLAPEVAVFCRLMGITMSALTTTAARPPDGVLVTGLGIVGLLGAMIFDSTGYRVIGCDPDEARRARARAKGVAVALERVPCEDPAYAGQIGLALECSGTEPAAVDACRAVRKGGEMILVGVPWKRTADTPAHDLLHAVFHQYVTVRSGWEWEVPLQPQEFRRGSIYGNFAAAMEWLARGRVDVSGLYEVTSPRRCQEAYQNLVHHRGEVLTYVFDWSTC
ncbi:MAG: dehydrogenase [candidate division WS1 bacterium]|jgi:threonine dehydrogenase-like Zn-dependent dehydrogenase|nr:dehydrogenase [candidate division WS1 bacterium]